MDMCVPSGGRSGNDTRWTSENVPAPRQRYDEDTFSAELLKTHYVLYKYGGQFFVTSTTQQNPGNTTPGLFLTKENHYNKVKSTN